MSKRFGIPCLSTYNSHASITDPYAFIILYSPKKKFLKSHQSWWADYTEFPVLSLLTLSFCWFGIKIFSLLVCGLRFLINILTDWNIGLATKNTACNRRSTRENGGDMEYTHLLHVCICCSPTYHFLNFGALGHNNMLVIFF